MSIIVYVMKTTLIEKRTIRGEPGLALGIDLPGNFLGCFVLGLIIGPQNSEIY